MVFHLYYIPILPLRTIVRFYCRHCTVQLDANRPNRPVILVLGILCGIFFSVMGFFVLFSTEDWEAGIGLIAFGLVMAAALVWLLRKQDYSSYQLAKSTVEPLPGDACPYCSSPLFASTKPRCSTCRLDIITR